MIKYERNSIRLGCISELRFDIIVVIFLAVHNEIVYTSEEEKIISFAY